MEMASTNPFIIASGYLLGSEEDRELSSGRPNASTAVLLQWLLLSWLPDPFHTDQNG